MKSASPKTCLVVSIGPVPTPEYKTIEGTGMRVWGLAKGLQKNGVDVTVAVKVDFPQNIDSHEGIKLVNWQPDQQFADLINSFDSVITSYCNGSDSVFIADSINDEVQLILDAYVPIYVEVSAREAKDIDTDYIHYMADVARYNHVLKRGDYFLCASETQKIYYTGVLSALGIINPHTYRQDRLIVAPFGIHNLPAKPTRNPYQKLGIKDDDFLVLWFGGLYPWFKIDEFLGAIEELSSNSKIKFAIVGGKNPFNPNPDLSRQYEHAVKFGEDKKLINKNLFFIDWVDFDDRINWYARANVVISINNPGEENTFAWRTRVMDYIWGELPILTNGGDPLSEQLLVLDAAIKLDQLSKNSIEAAIKDLVDNSDKLRAIKKSVIAAKPRYHWDSIVKPIEEVVSKSLKPNVNEAIYRKRLGVAEPSSENIPQDFDSPINVKKPLALSRRAISYARRKGLKRSAYLAYSITKTQLKKKASRNPQRRYVFISHPIDNTGAPLVLIKMVEQYADKFGARNIKVIAPGILPPLLKRLRQKGINVEKAALALGDRLIDLQLGLNKDDFLIMNTLAIYPNYRGFILRALASGRISHAYWFVHEDTAQIPLVARELMEEKEVKPIADLVNKGKLTIAVPSKKVQQDYMKLWKLKNVEVVSLYVDVPSSYKKVRTASNFSKINFLLSGAAADARKGQLLALSAFYDFIKNHFEKSPTQYRDFTLTLIGIGGDDYVSQQIRIIGELLDTRLKILPSIPHSESLEVTHKCNAVICCSLNETFAIYVAEAMYMGHVLLRNDSAGMDEQLKDGVNGFFVDTTNIKQFASVIEKVLNKKNLSNESLQNMGAASQEIIKKYADNSYLEQFEKLDSSQK
jgi:glycosyltransferase involved in cell wall biosynthesis